ncbi:hypothetical protein MWH03_00475 [Klebsiella pneumoniae]|nr:hypothetical protein [Klebsiella pneumoniae]
MSTSYDEPPFDVDDDIALHLQDELDRKTNETLIDVLTRLQDNLYTPHEARIAIRTLFSAVQGLVSPEYSENLNQALTEVTGCTNQSPLPAQLFYKGNVILLDADKDARKVILKMISPAGSVVSNEWPFEDENATYKEAIKRLIHMIKSGAKRI